MAALRAPRGRQRRPAAQRLPRDDPEERRVRGDPQGRHQPRSAGARQARRGRTGEVRQGLGAFRPGDQGRPVRGPRAPRRPVQDRPLHIDHPPGGRPDAGPICRLAAREPDGDLLSDRRRRQAPRREPTARGVQGARRRGAAAGRPGRRVLGVDGGGIRRQAVQVGEPGRRRHQVDRARRGGERPGRGDRRSGDAVCVLQADAGGRSRRSSRLGPPDRQRRLPDRARIRPRPPARKDACRAWADRRAGQADPRGQPHAPADQGARRALQGGQGQAADRGRGVARARRGAAHGGRVGRRSAGLRRAAEKGDGEGARLVGQGRRPRRPGQRPGPTASSPCSPRPALPKGAGLDGAQALITMNPAFARMGEENAFAVLAKAAELQRQGRDIINLGIGQPDFKTPPHIVEAAVKALRDGQHGYTAANGILPLREAVAADLHRRFGVEVSPDLVLIVPGGKVTMFMAILMFGAPGVDILYPDPGFPIYRSMIEYTGARPVPIPVREENGFAFSAEETLALMSERARLIILNSPANPTGGVTPKSEIDALVKGLAAFPDAAILSDEIYGQMTYDGLAHQTLLAYPEIRDRLILLDGWSKTYAMTGWRLGYSVWPKMLYDAARKLAVNSYSCVNAPAQFAGLAALTGPQDAVRAMVAEFDARRAVVVEGLNRLPGVRAATPKGAFYAFPNISATGWKAKPLASALLERAGVATVGGPDFGVHGEGYIRLSYANSTENIRRALGRIGDFLSSVSAAP